MQGAGGHDQAGSFAQRDVHDPVEQGRAAAGFDQKELRRVLVNLHLDPFVRRFDAHQYELHLRGGVNDLAVGGVLPRQTRDVLGERKPAHLVHAPVRTDPVLDGSPQTAHRFFSRSILSRGLDPARPLICFSLIFSSEGARVPSNANHDVPG